MGFSSAEKLAKLREHMAEYDLDAYIIPTADSHGSELPCPPDERRHYISEFTGTAGTAMVSKDEARLWVDGRYFLQAEKQLNACAWMVMKQGTPGCPKMAEVAKEKKYKRIGFDPYVTAPSFIEAFLEVLPQGARLVAVHQGTGAADLATEDAGTMKNVDKGQRNLVDLVWEADGTRPAYPAKPLVGMPDDVAGETVAHKLERIRKAMAEHKAGLLVMGALDDIAWTFNVRGRDNVESRLFIAYAVIAKNSAQIYLKNMSTPNRLDAAVVKRFQEIGVTVHPYEDITAGLSAALPAILPSETVWTDPSMNAALATICKAQVVKPTDPELKPIKETSPSKLFKTTKNQTELRGMIEAHIQDGAAVSLYLSWLLSRSPDELSSHTEWSVAEQLEKFRLMQEGFLSNSFATISSMDENSAVIHYRPTSTDHKRMNPYGIYLVDSGGHYTGGTTDITRTVHLGTPSAWQKEIYTRVLKGHVDLAMAKFVEGTCGAQLDLVARMPVWEIGMDYLHGTGHGVGHSLCVHEFPPVIGPKSLDEEGALKRNMVVSNEPGCYLNGCFGMRIENLQYVRENLTPHKFNDQTYVEFDQLTLAPYARNMIEPSLLNANEIRYINEYHRRVHQQLTAYVRKASKIPDDDKIRVIRWLESACAKI